MERGYCDVKLLQSASGRLRGILAILNVQARVADKGLKRFLNAWQISTEFND